MDKAVKRINHAIASNEKILVYGDYDVDGTTAVSLVYSFLKEHYPNIDYYIPDRYSEGYGISIKGVDFAIENDFKLVIALDCGIKAYKQITYAKENRVDFIVCDHHLPHENLPPAVAILDPKQPNCSYPFKELSGCGIGFKLLQAWCAVNSVDEQTLFKNIDLVAISIACDIVPIIGENRVLASLGLKAINETPRAGIASIRDMSQLKKPFSITDLVFIIGPRINAAGRISHAKSAVEFLLSTEIEEAGNTSKVIDDFNTSRREIDEQTTREALDLIESNQQLQQARSAVLYNENWHKGVIGIVASRVIEHYYRPTIILTQSNGMASGSARSVSGFDVYKAIEACSDLLEQFGGHKYAAGLTLKAENISVFRQKFEEIVSATIEPEMLIPKIDVDLELNLNEITPKLYRIIKQFAPFGPGNMKPVFLSKNLLNAGYTKAVGEDGDHLKLDLAQEGDGRSRFSGIAFNMGEWAKKLCRPNQLFQLVYQLDENEWQGNNTLQLKVKDIRLQ